jgi:hypothetical protein
MTTAPQPKIALLESLANEFALCTRQNQSLERHRLAVLTLRARGATYPQMRTLLKGHGIVVSDTSLSRFCCNYAADVARIRLQAEQEQEGTFSPSAPTQLGVTASPATPISSASSPPNPMGPHARKQRDLRGDY